MPTCNWNFSNFPYPVDRYGYRYDFTTDEEITEGVFTAINSGTNSVRDTIRGGYMLITGAGTTDDSGGEWQVDAANVVIAASGGKIVRYQACHRLSEATQSDLRTGMVVLDTSWIGSDPTDGIYFSKTDGAATLDFVVRAASATTFTATGLYTITDATDFIVSIQITPSGTTGVASRIEAWVGPNTLGTLPTKVIDEQTNTVVPLATIIMTSGVAFQSGSATGTMTCDTDWLGVEVLR